MSANTLPAYAARPAGWTRSLSEQGRNPLGLLLLAPMLLWIAVFFVFPTAWMIWQSFAERGLQPYAAILTSPIYLKVLMTTLKICVITTIGCLILGYPVAYVLTIAKPRTRAILLILVVLPYWLDFIVRSYSWMILLGRHGLINQLIMGMGLSRSSLPMLYNLFSVSIGMIQILLPLTILTLFSTMIRIDRRLIDAATIHGASPWHAFLTVFLPLSLPGVYAACLLLFVSALGFYVTPALLGGPEQTMISQTIMVIASDLLDWPLASAAGVLLLIVTTSLLLVYSRFFRLDRMLGGMAR
ncbi:MAG: ABC transporter permease [Hyphomicrobiales bacterium]|nr:ABC transporter permease [Hyphomicrobiales bacterium]